MRTVKLLPQFLALLLLTALSASAHAERKNPLEGQPAIRHRLELRKLRFEAAPHFMASINQDYKHAFGPGIGLQFHITDWLGIGVEGSFLINADTALEDRVRGQLPATYTPPGTKGAGNAGQPSLQIHDDHVLGMNGIGSAFASLTPFSGKMAIFSALFFQYDLYAALGLGFVNYTTDCCHYTIQPPPVAGGAALPDPNLQDARSFAGLKIGGMIGVGTHVFFNDWVALQLELRDYIVKANPGGGDVNGDRVLNSADEGIQHNIFFGAGVSFFLPPHAKISH